MTLIYTETWACVCRIIGHFYMPKRVGDKRGEATSTRDASHPAIHPLYNASLYKGANSSSRVEVVVGWTILLAGAARFTASSPTLCGDKLAYTPTPTTAAHYHSHQTWQGWRRRVEAYSVYVLKMSHTSPFSLRLGGRWKFFFFFIKSHSRIVVTITMMVIIMIMIILKILTIFLWAK